MVSKPTGDYIEHSGIIIGSQQNGRAFEIEISRAAGDEGWTITQLGDFLFLPDDEAIGSLILALTDLLELSN